ncbi:hypothetical protein RhiirA4_459938 [Rhizophagus irregularis]|uniref:DUF8211 domain-containing protein n=1 Tax=Rhizophagus irregularis TaxID=588596 RepID=A0A2I1GFJ7_9GLOM|nr:hypothetical protein RhiirA4_459938 [Rhizophagus irregularis]
MILSPEQPPTYLLNGPHGRLGVSRCAYTRKELQVIPENERPPPDSVIRGQPERFVPEQILQHRIRKGQDQRGCVTHQRFIDLFQNIKSSTNNNKRFINNKKSHATLSLNRWKEGRTKHVYSNRLGVSYDTSYTTNDSKYYYLKHNRCMYRKRFDNFNTHGHQLKNNRKTLQVMRFERACRSVFNNRSRYGKKHSSITNLEDQLARARHFIDDLTPIPFEEGKTWHAKLGFMVPNELMPHVNDKPIYISKRQEKLKGKAHEPGSKGWWDGIRSRKKRHDQLQTEQDEHKKRIEKAKL